MSKKRIVLASTLVILIAVMAAGTTAYFTGQGRATNVITTGKISVALNDEVKGGQKTDSGWTVEGVMPGSEYEKTVSVTNEGTGDAWVRVKADTNVSKDQTAMSGTFDKGDNKVVEICYENGTSEGKWINGGDGYYYYDRPVKPGEETSALFKKVKISSMLPNSYQGCVVSIDVNAQAVQAKNNGISWNEASGWPEETQE